MCKCNDKLFFLKKHIEYRIILICISICIYRPITHTYINGDASTYNKNIKSLNIYYFCNPVHNVKTLIKYINVKNLTSVHFQYKDRGIYIDIIGMKWSVNSTPLNDIILGDISLDNFIDSP